MSLELRRIESVDELLAVAGGFLVAREAEHNLLLGLCATARDHPDVYPDCRYVVGLDAGAVVAVAIQTVPHNVILSEMTTVHAAAIAEFRAGDMVAVPGVLGAAAASRAFADAWCARTRRTATIEMRQRIFRVDRVVRPRPAPGRWRFADAGDRALLIDWIEAFRIEASPFSPRRDDPAVVADRWLARAGRTIYLWDDAGEVVSMAGAGGDTPHGTRIGPVYTPLARRGFGYASNLVAATTEHQLATGRRFCFLFTDLANPTSNRIYQALGYAAVTDVDQWQFQGS